MGSFPREPVYSWALKTIDTSVSSTDTSSLSLPKYVDGSPLMSFQTHLNTEGFSTHPTQSSSLLAHTLPSLLPSQCGKSKQGVSIYRVIFMAHLPPGTGMQP